MFVFNSCSIQNLKDSEYLFLEFKINPRDDGFYFFTGDFHSDMNPISSLTTLIKEMRAVGMIQTECIPRSAIDDSAIDDSAIDDSRPNADTRLYNKKNIPLFKDESPPQPCYSYTRPLLNVNIYKQHIVLMVPKMHSLKEELFVQALNLFCQSMNISFKKSVVHSLKFFAIHSILEIASVCITGNEEILRNDNFEEWFFDRNDGSLNTTFEKEEASLTMS